MNAAPQPHRTRTREMTLADLDRVVAIEAQAYSFPWSHGNFLDSLAAGYLAEVFLDPRDEVIGYYVAMSGVDEMHLLNITISPAQQGRGHGRALLDHIVARARGCGALSLWLEVRESNLRARTLYDRYGFVQVGVRRAYYPAGHGTREDAAVMSLALTNAGRKGRNDGLD
ncbi:MAG TPA: ribosomal protein S18-alanine N-acetyltransferase [Burkholderiaceae bacterium]|nr:ribosomal protein S18-alanine N-acetyltransferase [Burkholderiaceae bacterium]